MFKRSSLALQSETLLHFAESHVFLRTYFKTYILTYINFLRQVLVKDDRYSWSFPFGSALTVYFTLKNHCSFGGEHHFFFLAKHSVWDAFGLFLLMCFPFRLGFSLFGPHLANRKPSQSIAIPERRLLGFEAYCLSKVISSSLGFLLLFRWGFFKKKWVPWERGGFIGKTEA